MSQAGDIDVIGTHPDIPIEFITDDGTATPIANQLEILATTVAAGSIPIETTGSGNTVTVEAQISQAIAATDATKIGLSAFNSAHFSVDANGFVSLTGGGQAIDTFTTDISGPVGPDGSGNVAFTGATNIFSDGSVANTMRLNVQGTNHALFVGRGSNTASANLGVGTDGQVLIAATGADPAFATLTSSDGSITFTPGANTLSLQVAGGTTVGKTITGNSGGALSPTAGNWNIFGAVIAAGTSPVVTSGAASTLTVNVQTSQALAAADATKIGLSNFSSTDFAVAATGFVTLSTTGAGKTITGDSGGALPPTANNWNILGGPGVTTSGSGSTLTINSVVFTDQGGSTSVTSDSGSFATAAITLTLPASPAQGELCQFVCTSASALVVDAPSTHLIRIGSLITSAGGTATSTAIGDSLTLRYRASDTTWYATSVIGTWVIA